MNPCPVAGSTRLPARCLTFARFCRLVCFSLSFVAFAVAVQSVRAAPQLLPGVHGYGLDRASNPAGFGAGATIIEVTNLNDSGPGSLRAAVLTAGPRVVVFKTSGVIELQSDLAISNPNITIAGQTAPSPGVSIHNGTLSVRTSNVLVQHLRIRPGDRWMTNIGTTNRDAVAISMPGVLVRNVVFDHCTFTWSLDEVASTWNDWDNVTFHKCIFAEPLHNSIHIDEGTFSPNVPQQAQNLVADASGFAGTTTETSELAIGGSYQVVNTDSDGDYVEYTVPIVPSSSNRGSKKLVIVSLSGPDRASFRVEVRGPSDTVLLSGNEIVDTYAATPAQHTYVADQSNMTGFTIPANAASLKVRLIVAGRNPASSGWALGIDQLAITDGHGFGPLFASGVAGEGKLAFIGSIVAHVAGRGPWSASKQFYYANNILYNRYWQGVQVGHSSWSYPIHAALVGNTFIEGPSASDSGSLPSPITNSSLPAGSQIFVGGAGDNAYNSGDRPSPPATVANNVIPFLVGSDPTVKTAGLLGVVAQSPADAFQSALVSAGARPVDRDAHEVRLVEEIARGAAEPSVALRPGSLKHSVEQAGGWPEYAVNQATWTLPADPHGDHNGDGYTNLEQWLHQLAAAVETTVNRAPLAHAGADQSVLSVPGGATGQATLDGRASHDVDGDNLTYHWTWAGGSATGSTPTVTLPIGPTVITLTVDDGRGGTDTDTVTVEVQFRAPVIALQHLDFTYSGEPKPATVVTSPEQLPYTVLYNGQPNPPTLPGEYTVVATVTDPAYADTVTGILRIRATALVRHAPSLNGTVDGSVQVLLAEDVTLNAQANVSGDLLVPGTPAILLNGSADYGGTTEGPGQAAPSAHRVTLNSGARLDHVVRRVDPIALPTVARPLAPAGTQDITLNRSSTIPDDFSVVRNLTLNTDVGPIDVPPGSYGHFAANRDASFRFGVAGSTEPAVYDLQSLTLNSGARLLIAGPVVLTLGNSLALNGVVGSPGNPDWLTIRFATGGATLNGSVSFFGSIIAPSGTVSLNGGAQLSGHVMADRLTINTGATLRHTADRVSPQVAITVPSENANVSGIVVLTAQASDDTGIASVQFLLNGTKLGAEDAVPPYTVPWNTAQAAVGANVLTAVARDVAGNTSTSEPVMVTVLDQLPPTVTLTAPAPNTTVSGVVALAAEASDNVGVVGVTFLLDGAPVAEEVVAPPFGLSWDTAGAPNGSHVLTAVARDAAGLTTTSSPISVLVLNSAGTRIAYAEDFSDGLAQGWETVSGTWGVTNGYYAQTANNYPDIALYGAETWRTDFTYRASLRTSWSATNNRLGLIYNYVNAGNYYYAIFNAGGLAEINRVIAGGAPVVVASGAYPGGGSGVWFDVSVVRSGSNTSLVVNDHVVFSDVPQSELGAGRIGFITRFNGSARFDNVEVAVNAPSAVFDTFESGTADGWATDGGTWAVAVDGATHVYRQSNATIVSNRSFRSGTDWADQVVEADVKLNAITGSNRFFGIVARYQGLNDYYYFVLRTNQTMELKRLASGVALNLTPPVAASVVPGTWYRLRLEVAGTTLRAYVNGELKMQGTDTMFASGSGGLLTFFSDVSFDDVHIDPAPDNPLLTVADFTAGADEWTAAGGAWSVVDGGAGNVLRQSDPTGLAYSLIGDGSWSDQIVELDARGVSLNGDGAWFGMVARYVDSENHYAVALRDAHTVELRKVVGGVTTVLGTASVAVATGTWQSLRLNAVGGSLKVYLNGALLVAATDPTFEAGRFGLATSSAAADFDDVLIVAP